MEQIPIGENPKKFEKEEAIEKFRGLRDDFSSEIPEEIIHSDNPDNKYKVRTAWFTAVSGYLEFFVEDYLDPEDQLAKDIEEFRQYLTSEQFAKKALTELSDIERADDLLNRAIEHLENL